MDVRRAAVPTHYIYHDFLEYVQIFLYKYTQNLMDRKDCKQEKVFFLTGRGQEVRLG
jgi:hypothetical protein